MATMTGRPAIVAALYALKLQVDRSGDVGDIWELETRHHAFHRALLAACGSTWLLEFFERLYAATERYRIPILLDPSNASGRDIQAEHTALADATLARDEDTAIALLRMHYKRSEATIYEKMTAEQNVPEAFSSVK